MPTSAVPNNAIRGEAKEMERAMAKVVKDYEDSIPEYGEDLEYLEEQKAEAKAKARRAKAKAKAKRS